MTLAYVLDRINTVLGSCETPEQLPMAKRFLVRVIVRHSTCEGIDRGMTYFAIVRREEMLVNYLKKVHKHVLNKLTTNP